MDKVNSVLVYKVHSQLGTWIFTDYYQGEKIQRVNKATLRPSKPKK